jgi:tetratricopeptide (TPR) repeat protein
MVAPASPSGTAAHLRLDMNILTLIFSGPGATIVVCLTVLAVATLYLAFPKRFGGLSFGYKEFKLETPEAQKPQTQASVEVIEDSRSVVKNPKAADEEDSFTILFRAVAKQDRKEINAACEKLKGHPIFSNDSQRFEAFKFNQLLDAGFMDALENLKEVEKTETSQIDASLHLARYYFKTRSFDDAEVHLETAEAHARADGDRATLALLRAEIIEFVSNKGEAVKYLTKQLDILSGKGERFRFLNEIGRLQKDNYKEAEAERAYEHALRLVPENVETRFKLALIYGANPSLRMLAIRHYRIILEQNHLHAGALNNLGLLYGQFGISIAKVDSIKMAADRNDGHAIGNLASLYIEAGFRREAEKLLSDISREVDKSDRVLAVRQQLRRAINEDAEKMAGLSRESEKLANYVNNLELAQCFVPEEYIGKWSEVDGIATLEIEKVNWYYRLTSNDKDKKLFSYCNSLFSISHIQFAKEDRPPLGLLAMNSGEISAALIFSELRSALYKSMARKWISNGITNAHRSEKRSRGAGPRGRLSFHFPPYIRRSTGAKADSIARPSICMAGKSPPWQTEGAGIL